MAICNALTRGVGLSCDTNIGGIRKVFIGYYDDLLTNKNWGAVMDAPPTIDGDDTYWWSTQIDTDYVLGGVSPLYSISMSIGTTAAGANFTFTKTGDYRNILKVGQTITPIWGSINPITPYSYTSTVQSVTYNSGTNTTTMVLDGTNTSGSPLIGGTATIDIMSAGYRDRLNTTNALGFPSMDLFEFQFGRNTSSYEETSNVSIENGTTFYTSRVTLNLHRREKLKREAIVKLAAGQQKLILIVQDNNDKLWIFGTEGGMILQELAGGSGVAKTDANLYGLTFQGEESYQTHELNSFMIGTLTYNTLKF